MLHSGSHASQEVKLIMPKDSMRSVDHAHETMSSQYSVLNIYNIVSSYMVCALLIFRCNVVSTYEAKVCAPFLWSSGV